MIKIKLGEESCKLIVTSSQQGGNYCCNRYWMQKHHFLKKFLRKYVLVIPIKAMKIKLAPPESTPLQKSL
jgi:hypothetical protein